MANSPKIKARIVWDYGSSQFAYWVYLVESDKYVYYNYVGSYNRRDINEKWS